MTIYNSLKVNTMNDILNILKETPFFKDIDSETLKKLSQNCRIIRLKPKEMLFHEGFEGDSFFLLLEGAVRIFKTSPDGSETTIKIVNPEEFFAEVVLFDPHTYPVSAVALKNSTLIKITREAFSKMLESSKAREKFVASLFSKMRFLSDKVHFLNSYDVEDRFFKFLIDHYGKHYRYEITIPKKEIASAIGTIPETFSRLILRLTKMGIIAWKQKTLFIKEGFWEDTDFFD